MWHKHVTQLNNYTIFVSEIFFVIIFLLHVLPLWWIKMNTNIDEILSDMAVLIFFYFVSSNSYVFDQNSTLKIQDKK